MLSLWLFTAITVSLFAFPNAAAAQRVALIIANSEYEHTSQLANPGRDATLISAALSEAGFDTVELARDLDRTEFMTGLRDFSAVADGADVALIYFAGHAVESDGRNWLLPVDATLSAERDLPFESVELARILDTLYGAKLRIAILDACRNNPFANRWGGETRSASRGLAPFEVDDILVMYAAAPGAFAFDGADGNSPFALALARRIVQPGLPVQMLGGMVRDDVLTATGGEQRPFVSASMTGRPMFLVDGPETEMAWFKRLYTADNDARTDGSGRPADNRPAGTGPADSGTVDYAAFDTLDASRGLSNADPDTQDERVWVETLRADSVPAYRAYLEQFPEGIYARFAEANIAQLLDPTALGGAIESDKPWIISLGAALPDRYAVDLGPRQPIDGVWRISTNDKRLRIERGRAFAVDGWNHALLFRVEPEQVTMIDIRRDDDGAYLGRDILLNGDARMTVRDDGNLDVTVGTFPFPVTFVLIREALDDSEAELISIPD